MSHFAVWCVTMAILVMASCSKSSAADAPAIIPTASPTPIGRFLVFTDADPVTTDAVRDVVARHGGLIADEVHVSPDLVMLVVRVPPEARAELERLPGVREVAPDVAPSPADGAEAQEPG
ncbi:MAG TPA: hypothetical protein VFH48_05920 [Chloroflexota bacterium]|nr:hypothetical protein [Chloroflexota bacterium]